MEYKEMLKHLRDLRNLCRSEQRWYHGQPLPDSEQRWTEAGDALDAAIEFIENSCPQCHGTGFVQRHDGIGLDAYECPVCHGSGDRLEEDT